MKRHAKGFSLVETLVAALIVAVALLALAMLLTQNIRTNQASGERMNAAQASQEILADYAQRVLANNLVCAVGTTCTFQGTYKEFRYTLYATNNGTSWALRVVLTPAQGGRMKPYENQLFVNTVAGLNAQNANVGAGAGGSGGGGAGAGGGGGAGGSGGGGGAGGGGSGGGTGAGGGNTGGGGGGNAGGGGNTGGGGTGTGAGGGNAGGGNPGGGGNTGGGTTTTNTPQITDMNGKSAVVSQPSPTVLVIDLYASSPPKGAPDISAVIDANLINTWMQDAAFKAGVQNKQGDLTRYTTCSVLNTPGTSGADVLAAFYQAATSPNTDWNKLKKALDKFNQAISQWNSGNPTLAGEQFAKALGELAKAVGC